MGDWIKVEKLTPDKPELAILARKLKVSQAEAFLNWFRVYSWADGITCPGFVPHLSPDDADTVAHAARGTCAALASPEIGWIQVEEGGLRFANWDRHNGKSAKSRGLEAEKKRKQRGKSEPPEGDLSRKCPDGVGTKLGTRREETRGEFQSSKSDRKTNGNSVASQSPTSSLPPKDACDGKCEERDVEPLDLSDLDWGHVASMAEFVARRIPARSKDDRRFWLKLAVAAERLFSEDWLVDSVEAVVRAKKTETTRQRHFMGVVRSKAEGLGVKGRAWNDMLKSIEIPPEVWNSSVVEVRK